MSKVKNTQITETSRVILNEALDYAGRFLSAYARLLEAERNADEEAFAQAWGDLTTVLFILKDKAEHSHQLLEEE